MKKTKSSVFIISAPSGSGKTTLIEKLLEQIPSLLFSVSHTTRQPREGERDGVDYFFINDAEFNRMISEGRFLEWAQVHGHYYGTSRNMLERAENESRDLILDIDVQGAALVRKELSDAVSIFIMPPSFAALQERLMRRQTDSKEVMQKRLGNAKEEIRRYHEFDFVIINDDIQPAYENLAGILRGMRCRRQFQEEQIKSVLETFDSR